MRVKVDSWIDYRGQVSCQGWVLGQKSRLGLKLRVKVRCRFMCRVWVMGLGDESQFISWDRVLIRELGSRIKVRFQVGCRDWEIRSGVGVGCWDRVSSWDLGWESGLG